MTKASICINILCLLSRGVHLGEENGYFNSCQTFLLKVFWFPQKLI